jgi:hypothetical protein
MAGHLAGNIHEQLGKLSFSFSLYTALVGYTRYSPLQLGFKSSYLLDSIPSFLSAGLSSIHFLSHPATPSAQA